MVDVCLLATRLNHPIVILNHCDIVTAVRSLLILHLGRQSQMHKTRVHSLCVRMFLFGKPVTRHNMRSEKRCLF